MEQYQLARVRRGLSIDHEVPGEGEYRHRGERVEGEDHNSRGRNDAQDLQGTLDHLNREAGIDRSDDFGDLDETLGDRRTEEEQRFIDDFDIDLLENEGSENNHEGVHQGSHQDSNRQSSGSLHSKADMNNVSSSTNTGKRPADITGNADRDPKRANTGKNKLPGTGKVNDTPVAEGGPRGFELPTPYNGLKTYTRHFRKVHRTMTWGFNYNTVDFTQYWYCTTPLCDIPWNWLYLYINASEYGTLARGAGVEKVRVSVVQRNVRVAFPTNSTANNLATLNQNKNIVYSKGLNLKGFGQPGIYTAFQTNQPMIPTDFVTVNWANHQRLSREMYFNPVTADFANETPRHQFGIPQVFPMYYIAQLQKPNAAAAQGNLNGWPCFQNWIHEVDADATTGNVIVECEYHPKSGLITLPKNVVDQTYIVGNANTFDVLRGSHNLDVHRQRITRVPAAGDPNNKRPNTSISQVQAVAPIQGGLAESWNLQNHVQIIEKSQVYHKGLYAHIEPVVQPSLHIGVQPTPALTSSAVTGASNNSFTDTQSYFEIICEIEINENYSCPFPGTGDEHMTPDNFWVQVNRAQGEAYPNPFRSTYNGLYVGTVA